MKKYPLAHSQVSNRSLEASIHFTDIKKLSITFTAKGRDVHVINRFRPLHVCRLSFAGWRSWKTWVHSDFFWLLSDSLFHMKTQMGMRQFQFIENGLSVNTLITDERSPPLDGMERRVSSTVGLRYTANSKRESVVPPYHYFCTIKSLGKCRLPWWSLKYFQPFLSLHYSHAYHVLTLFFVSGRSPFSVNIFSRYQPP